MAAGPRNCPFHCRSRPHLASWLQQLLPPAAPALSTTPLGSQGPAGDEFTHADMFINYLTHRADLEVTNGLVSAAVHERSPVEGSAGAGGVTTSSGAVYVCRDTTGPTIAPAGTLPTIAEVSTPNCSGHPRFQAAGVAADTTKRLFFAGISGALAATLLVEAVLAAELGERFRRQVRKEGKAGSPGLFG